MLAGFFIFWRATSPLILFKGCSASGLQGHGLGLASDPLGSLINRVSSTIYLVYVSRLLDMNCTKRSTTAGFVYFSQRRIGTQTFVYILY